MHSAPLIKPCTITWIILILLTALTYTIGEMGLSGLSIVAFVLVTALLKGQMVVDYFMGLKRVRAAWRGLLFGYLLLVCSMIGLAYYLSLTA